MGSNGVSFGLFWILTMKPWLKRWNCLDCGWCIVIFRPHKWGGKSLSVLRFFSKFSQISSQFHLTWPVTLELLDYFNYLTILLAENIPVLSGRLVTYEVFLPEFSLSFVKDESRKTRGKQLVENSSSKTARRKQLVGNNSSKSNSSKVLWRM